MVGPQLKLKCMTVLQRYRARYLLFYGYHQNSNYGPYRVHELLDFGQELHYCRMLYMKLLNPWMLKWYTGDNYFWAIELLFCLVVEEFADFVLSTTEDITHL